MSNTSPERIPLGDFQSEVQSQPSKSENAKLHNEPQQQSVLQTLSESQSLQIKRELHHPFVGIRQYTSQFSPKLANPGVIKRSRLIYDKLCQEYIKDYPGWYIAIESR